MHSDPSTVGSSLNPLTPETSISATPFARHSRLAVDLAYADERPSTGTSLKRFFADLWAALKRFRLFVQLACIDIRKHPCSYVLSLCAVLVVVLLCVVMLSILSTAPVIFQRLAEGSSGSVDLTISAGGIAQDSPTLNYTQVKALLPLEDGASSGYHAPRLQLSALIMKDDGCLGASAAERWAQNDSDDGVCHGTPTDCLVNRCGNAVLVGSAGVILHEPELEARMGYNADVTLPAIENGQIFLNANMAGLLNISVGDAVLILAEWTEDLQCLFHNMTKTVGDVIIPLVVAGLISGTGAKFAETRVPVIVPYNSLSSIVLSGMRPIYSQAQRDVIAATPTDECVNIVNFNVPPADRDETYRSSDYNTIQRRISTWASDTVTVLGSNQVGVVAPVLSELYDTRMFSVFVGLIVCIIILALVFFSIVLIYSLINVNLETRMFELGIQRMIGFTRADLVLMVLVNTYFSAIPGWLAGLGLGQALYLGVRAVFQSLVAVDMDQRVSPSSIGWASLVGLVIPLVASFFPILALVTLSLPMALDASRRPGASGVIYRVKRHNGAAHRGTLFVLGLLFAVFGILIYYLFPLSLLRMNLTLMFYIFFGVLIGLLIGLTLLVLNVENLLELLLLYALLFWESSAVFTAIRKSLVSHRLRNRKTTLMYALSVAFILFITVAFDIQFVAFRFDTYQAWGTDVRVLKPQATLTQMAVMERELHALLADVGETEVPEMTYQIGPDTACRPLGKPSLQSPGRYSSVTNYVQSLPPNFFEVMDKRFLRVNKQRKDLTEPYSLGGALYTAEAGNRVLMSSSTATVLTVENLDQITLAVNDMDLDNYSETLPYLTTVVQVAATLDASATVAASPYPSTEVDVVASLPLATRLVGEPYMSVNCFTAIKISLNGNGNQKMLMQALKFGLMSAGVEHVDVGYVDQDTSDVDMAGSILNLFLIFALIMILVICFFSLMSTMTTNVFNSSKEIGIFLCLGMRHSQLYRVYLWEAFLLVFSSGLLGVVIGVIVAYTMQMQNVLLTQLPVPYSFPYIQFLIVVGVGLLSAFLASFAPVRHLLSLPSVTHILRRNVSN